MKPVLCATMPVIVLLMTSLVLSFPQRSKTSQDIIDAASRQGLHCRPSSHNRIIVSRKPISRQDELAVRAFSIVPDRLICYVGANILPCNVMPGRSVVWSDVLVQGDPELVEELTGIQCE